MFSSTSSAAPNLLLCLRWKLAIGFSERRSWGCENERVIVSSGLEPGRFMIEVVGGGCWLVVRVVLGIGGKVHVGFHLDSMFREGFGEENSLGLWTCDPEQG